MIPIWLWAVLVPGLGLLALDRFALHTIRPPRKKHARTIQLLPFRVRAHRFTSLGQSLQGWFVEPEEDLGGAVVVLVHGWGSSHGRMTLLAEPLLKAGHPVFLFDVRHHGESFDAPYVTIRHFRDDTRAAVAEVSSAFPDRSLVLIGHSMGGSASVLAVVEGAPVDGLVTVGAPADLWGIWADFFDLQGLPGRWVTRVLRPFWRYRAGESFAFLDPVGRVGGIRVPILVLHGDQDASVPLRHAHSLADAAGTGVAVMAGEGHNDLLGKDSVHREVLAFLEGLRGKAASVHTV